MEATITVYCKNTHTYHEVPRGISLIQLKDLLGIRLKYPIIAAHVNYKVENLDFLLYKPKDVEFLDASSPEHPISKGYYCTLQWHTDKATMPEDEKEPPVVTPEMINAIKERMKLIVAENRPIEEEEKQTKEVIKMFAERFNNESSIFETLGNPYCRYFRMGDFIDYYSNVLLPSSGYITLFDIEPFKDGMLVRIPNRTNPLILEDSIPQEKMFSIFQEYNRWNKLLHINLRSSSSPVLHRPVRPRSPSVCRSNYWSMVSSLRCSPWTTISSTVLIHRRMRTANTISRP